MSDDRGYDEKIMRRCIELAAGALRAGNTPVGSVVVAGGAIIAEAAEECPAGPDPFAHAELIAVREALRLAGKAGLEQATLYSTNEPCILCSYAVRHARIWRVVAAVETPHIGGYSSSLAVLRAGDVPRWGPAPEVVIGVLAEEYRLMRLRT